MMGQATTDAVTAAREIAPELSARAVEAEELKTLPRDLVERARAAGLFRLATPRALGGLELPPAEVVEVVEELCRADGSAGWTIMIGNGSAFLAWLDPAAAADLLAAAPDPIGGGVFAPMGRLTGDGDGKFGLTGRWSFCSGSPHADLFFGGAFADGDPRDWRLAFVPAAGVRVLDNWDVTGLRGTGSHDVEIDAVVRAEHTASPFTNPARHDGPQWRFPFFTLVGTMMAGVPLGIARRALDEFTTFAPAKFRPPGPGPIAEDGDVQIALTRAEGRLRSARAFVFDALGDLWETACAGDVPDTARRGQFLLATQQAMQAALSAVNTAFGFAGAGALHADQPIQRCFRDLHAASQHIYFSTAASKRYAKLRFGIDQPTFWF
ncbi:acyl-CoA dehydrogenase family protein [Amycolatopsis sp. SID8362]|uniref:acyl-CoA dehydrogenase family protein n=1 Tax=Amycolatopsis sp. SID8362 TaxID=2690346 RepID=UPI001371C67D|nr:acyl-CoA dehydrogenase family protein [Amycolatopsis sp. SID8362]NBH10014.1 hydroxylase [Amycolatopsis sp. SID8362]NED46708.1 hydroxylase [Amycolatopsis sp. SID8362]